MIVVRAPFRLPLGGGSTDLPSYYRHHGGFFFGVSVNHALYVIIKRCVVDDLIRLKYSESETVASVEEIRHQIVRAALLRHRITKGIEIASLADIPDKTGMGTSGSYAVGLLWGLRALTNTLVSPEHIAEEACNLLIQDLGLPDGKQDPYISAIGGFVACTIDTDGAVSVERLAISPHVVSCFEENVLIFNTGVRRSSVEILRAQDDASVLYAKRKTHELGFRIKDAFVAGDLTSFGLLMDEHWRVKCSMGGGITNPDFNRLYECVKAHGALGGKIMGAGGGGFFMLYAEGAKRDSVRKALSIEGLREIPWRVDERGVESFPIFSDAIRDHV